MKKELLTRFYRFLARKGAVRTYICEYDITEEDVINEYIMQKRITSEIDESLQLVADPHKEEYNMLMRGLEDDFKKEGEGFWVNRNIIDDAYYQKNLIILFRWNTPIGFITFQPSNPIHISIINIDTPYRYEGYGGDFLDMAKEYFKDVYNAKTIVANAMNEDSLRFFKRHGFEHIDGVTVGSGFPITSTL